MPLFLVGLSLGGCLAKSVLPLAPEAIYSVEPDVLLRPAALSRTRPATVPVELRPTGETGGYRVYDLEVPSVGSNRQPGDLVRGRYFRSRGTGKRPLIIVLPIWGSSPYPPTTLTRHLIRRAGAGSLHVLRLIGHRRLIDWETLAVVRSEAAFRAELERAVATYQTTVEDIRRLVDWGRRRPEVDGRRVGLVGFSVGAIVGGLVVGVEPRIWRAALVMGGARSARIFASCGGHVGRVRHTLLRRFAWSVEEYSRRLEPLLEPVDPANFGSRIDPRQVLLIDAEGDRCVPRRSRDALWDALGRPERISIHGGHRWAFLSMTRLDGQWTTRRIREFLTAPEADDQDGTLASS